MRVLITSTRYYPNFGGVENSINYLAKECVKRGYSVDIVSSNIVEQGYEKPKLIENISSRLNIFRYSYYFFGSQNVLASYFNCWKLYKELISKKNYDIVIARNHVSVIILKLSGFKNVSYILPGVMFYQIEIPNTDSCNRLIFIRRFIGRHYHNIIQKWALKLTDRSVVFSNNMYNQVKSNFGFEISDNVKISKPGIDPNIFFYDPNICFFKENFGDLQPSCPNSCT